MRKAALAVATVTAPTTANARGWFGPAVIGGLAAGALFAGLASSAYAWQPHGYYRYPRHPGGGYVPAYYQPCYYRPYYYRHNSYYPGYYGSYYAPYNALTVGYAPRHYGYRYRRVYRPANYYYDRPILVRYGHTRWHRHRHWRHHRR